MRQCLLVAAMILVTAAGSARAQDPTTSAPDIYRKVLENDRLRVLEARFKPGAKMGLHHHPDHVFYMISGGTLVFRPEGKRPYEVTLASGEALWLPAQSRATENDTDKDIRAVVVELKQPAPAVTAKRGAKPKTGKGKRSRR